MPAKVLKEMVLYFQQDVKRINHALKVYGFAKAISGNENVPEKHKTVIELAAILHDIGIKEAERKYNSPAGKYQELEGPPIAEAIMREAGIDESVIERVCFLIGNHHSYSKIDGIDFQILVEADFIVNIEEGSIDIETASNIVKNYFKTATGKMIIASQKNHTILL